MKWYYWLGIAVIIIIIITLVVKNNKKKDALLNQIAANTNAPKPFNPFDLTTITAKR